MTPGVRPLVAGNWKMNGLSASLVEITAMAERSRRAKRARPSSPSARRRPCSRRPPGRSPGSRLALGGQDCNAKAERRLHRRHLRGDAADAGALRDRRPFRAPRRFRRDRRRREGQGARRRAGGPDRRSSASARPAPSARPAGGRGGDRARCAARCRRRRDAGASSSPTSRLGDRHGPDADRRRRRRDARGDPRAAGRVRRGGGRVRILYGGSVKPANARNCSACANVDGALVGGAASRRPIFWRSPPLTLRA